MSLLPGVLLSAPERQRAEMQSAEMKVNVIASSFLLAVLAFVGAPVIAQDASGVQSVVSVEGWVPVICQASAPDLHPEEGISGTRSEEHTSELQSLMRISYAVFCLKKKKNNNTTNNLL